MLHGWIFKVLLWFNVKSFILCIVSFLLIYLTVVISQVNIV